MNIRSLQRLDKVHPDLARLMIEASKKCPVDIEISEGVRTKTRQAELVKAGASQTMNSRHLTGHAADFFVTVGGKARWDWPLYTIAGQHIEHVARVLGIDIVWGGRWTRLRDGPHVELARKYYP